MMSLRPLAALTMGASLVVGLTACSLPPVKANPANRANTSECAAAAKAWPLEVVGLEPYPVTTPSDAVRAWGKRPESAVIARCGVSSPGPTTQTCFAANGVDWVELPLDDGRRYVTYGREPAIEVLVPKKAGLDGSVLASFAPAAQKIPQGRHRCS